MESCLVFVVVLQEFFPPNKQNQEAFEKHFNAHGLEKLVTFQVSHIQLYVPQDAKQAKSLWLPRQFCWLHNVEYRIDIWWQAPGFLLTIAALWTVLRPLPWIMWPYMKIQHRLRPFCVCRQPPDLWINKDTFIALSKIETQPWQLTDKIQTSFRATLKSIKWRTFMNVPPAMSV